MPDLREKVALIVDPDAFDDKYGTTVHALLASRRETALTKADAILIEVRKDDPEPTEAMILAGMTAERSPETIAATNSLDRQKGLTRDIYKAMRAALPTPPEVK